MITMLISFFKIFSKLWGKMPDEGKEKVITIIVENYDVAFKAFYKYYRDQQQQKEKEEKENNA